jgi:hypothetical protein
MRSSQAEPDPRKERIETLGALPHLDRFTVESGVIAAEILEAASDRGNSALARLDTVPGGYVADVTAPSPDSLAAAPLTALRAVDTALGAHRRRAPSVTTRTRSIMSRSRFRDSVSALMRVHSRQRPADTRIA